MAQDHFPSGGELSYRLEMANHRATIRYQCAPATPGQVHLADGHEYQRGWVQNLSISGVGLLLSREVVRGMTVVILLKSADGGKAYHLEARVVHSTQQPSGDWLVGCEFLKQISDDDLDCLLYANK